VLIEDLHPATIADAVNSLNKEKVDAYKRNSLVAARDLNWEQEGERLVRAYAKAIGRHDDPAFCRTLSA
jgi:hypothetical protein